MSANRCPQPQRRQLTIIKSKTSGTPKIHNLPSIASRSRRAGEKTRDFFVTDLTRRSKPALQEQSSEYPQEIIQPPQYAIETKLNQKARITLNSPT